MALRPCLGHAGERCTRLTDSPYSRCPEHQRQHVAHRPGARQRGYNTEYEHNRAIVLRLSDVCHLCGRRGADTADHLVPVSKGGTAAIVNLRPAHGSCNNKRKDRLISR